MAHIWHLQYKGMRSHANQYLLVHVFHVVDGDERIIDGHNVDIGLVCGSAHYKTGNG